MSSLRTQLVGLVPRGAKDWIKGVIGRTKAGTVRFALSYSVTDLDRKLESLGLKSGDAVMLHAAFGNFNGFRGGAHHVIDCILDILGPRGHLFMMSMAYTGSSREYVEAGNVFDVRRTPSRMGLLSESFRRRAGVVRSGNPLHPVLALGPRAQWVIADHENLEYSCGPRSPFEKLLELDAKALFFDVDLDVLTFTHYIEDLFRDTAPLPVYTTEPLDAPVIDSAGVARRVRSYAFSREAVTRRDFTKLYDRLETAGKVERDRIGNTTLAVLRLRDLVECAREIVESGDHIFGRPGSGTRAKPSRGGPLGRIASISSDEITSGRLRTDATRLVRRVLGPYLKRRQEGRLPPEARDELERDRQGLPAADPGAPAVIEAALDWLAVAQDQTASKDDGIARHYSLVSGWSTSYPETTGYAIPTLLETTGTRAAERHARARRMLDWLVGIQLEGGGFQGGMIDQIPVRPVTFNTGQILIGLAVGARVVGEARYEHAMHAAARWLVHTQDGDGCWRQFSSPFAGVDEHTYDTHVAWGLLEAARTSGVREYGEAAIRNIHWALTHQRVNGWFGRCCLEHKTEPLTHTIGYTLRGVIEGYLWSNDATLLPAAERTAKALLRVMRPDGYIPGQLMSDWSPAAQYACLTGTVQIAACWFMLHRITGNAAYLAAARVANGYVRRTIRLDGPTERRGAVKGSFPVDGYYATFEYPNWAAKFLIDSNRMELAAAGE